MNRENNTNREPKDKSRLEAERSVNPETAEILKALWYLIMITLLTLIATVVFMGIEGTSNQLII